jgi:hypothetical protein
VKHTPPSPPMNFEELVERAKASETPLGAHDLERMLKNLQARAAVDPQLSSLGASPSPVLDAPPPPRLTKAGIAGSLGGLGLLAALAVTYGTEGDVEKSNPETVTLVEVNDEVSRLNEPEAVDSPVPGTRRETSALDDTKPTNETTPAAKRAPERPPLRKPTATNSRVAPKTSAPVESDTNTASAAPSPQPSASTPRPAPAPTLDASLERLERAERELRNGQPADALVTLAIPVTPSLSSRAEALRAVALCQSGQKAAGTELARAHLTRNPRSPYAKRLNAACGSSK